MIGAPRDMYVVLTGDMKSKEALNWKWFEMVLTQYCVDIYI